MKIKDLVLKYKYYLVAVGAVLVVAGGAGAWYWYGVKGFTKTEKQSSVQNSSSNGSTSQQVQDNVSNKISSQNASGTSVTPTSNQSGEIGDVSLSALLNTDTKTDASVSLYGPGGTYQVQKLVASNWTNVGSSFSYSGSGGYQFDTVSESDGTVHYRVELLVNGAVSAVSGDTAIEFSNVLTNITVTIPVTK